MRGVVFSRLACTLPVAPGWADQLHVLRYSRDEEEEDIAQKIEELQKNEAELRQMLEKRAKKT